MSKSLGLYPEFLCWFFNSLYILAASALLGVIVKSCIWSLKTRLESPDLVIVFFTLIPAAFKALALLRACSKYLVFKSVASPTFANI